MKICPICRSRFDDSVRFCTKDREVLLDGPEAFVGELLDGQYQIEEYIGSGAMGHVYRARDLNLDDEVAIKTLPRDVSNDPMRLRRFRREGIASRRLQEHPNIVSVYGLRTTQDDLTYLVLEYVRGNDLQKELDRRGKFSPEKALRILEPLANALNFAHQLGVVHRDLKPGNVMVEGLDTARPTVKLLDLGLTKLTSADDAVRLTALTLSGHILGTPYYISPEQWGAQSRDGGAEIDGRADIYSLGIIAFQMVCGALPFQGDTIAKVMQQHLTAPPPFAHDIDPGVPKSFSYGIAHALAKDRADRPGSAEDLIAELKSSKGETTIVRPPHQAVVQAALLSPQPIQPIRRRKVTGLTVSLHKACVQVLRQCREFNDMNAVAALFGIDPLTKYASALPLEARSQLSLVELVIHNLITYPATNGRPLLDLLVVLRDKRDEGEPEAKELDDLLQQVTFYLNIPPQE